MTKAKSITLISILRALYEVQVTIFQDTII
jgi:hypothetical protein